MDEMLVSMLTSYSILFLLYMAFSIYKICKRRTPGRSSRPSQKKHNDSTRPDSEIFNYQAVLQKQRHLNTMRDEEAALTESIQNAARTHDFPSVVQLVQEHLSRYDLTDPDIAIAAHFFLINSVQSMYYFRNEDPLAYNHCLMLCDMDIENYENLSPEIVRNDPVLPERKAIILEKMDWLEDAAELCRQAIQRNWGYSSMPWDKRLTRLQGRIASTR